MSIIRSFQEYLVAYEKSVQDPEGFWSKIAEEFIWYKPWDRVLSWNFTEPDIRWFEGGGCNIIENCLDRHVRLNPDRIALLWEPNDPTDEPRSLTYRILLEEVKVATIALRNLGVNKGDRVCIYMPMVPEAVIAMLACARMGAIHSVVFGGFSAQSLVDRIQHASCTTVITADSVMRGGKEIPLKQIVDEALSQCPTIRQCIVYQRTNTKVGWKEGRDLWWHDWMNQARKSGGDHSPAHMASEDPLFILYTSGSTGKPKGVLHTCGGYMVYAWYTFMNVFQYQEEEIYWCTADVGWITGHTYIVYGPLLSGATILLFEGIPTWPDPSRMWQIVERYGVHILYTAPTAIRSLEAAGNQWVTPFAMPSLRVLGSVGEPINEEAWHWFHQQVGKGRCPIVDTWWQTETGGICISPLAGITPLQPAFAMLPLPGIQLCLVDDSGGLIEGNDCSGNLCIQFPWPGMLRTTYGDHERCRTTYFEQFAGYYSTGDGCYRDKNGYYRITGRNDDVLKVSGHRIGTAEVENAINKHPFIVESACVGCPHPVKGQGIYVFAVCPQLPNDPDALRSEISNCITKEIGAFARPEYIQLIPGLPKTRSGKIMRRILRKIAGGDIENLGDVTTLLDPDIVETILKGKIHP